MTTPDPLEPAIEAGLTEVGRMLAGVPVDGEEATLADHVRAAVRAAAPIIAAQALRQAAESLTEQAIDAGIYSAQHWLRHLAENGQAQ